MPSTSRPRASKPTAGSNSSANSAPRKKKGKNSAGGEDDGEEETSLVKPGETQVTKRTLQNRKAQREFRKRREARVKELEERVRRFDEMGLEANQHLQRTARRLKDENEALRGLLVRLGHGNMIHAALEGLGDGDHHEIGYPSQGLIGLTGPGAMDFGSMGGKVGLSRSNGPTSNSSNRKATSPYGSPSKRKRGDSLSEDEEDEDDEDEDQEEEEEEEIQPQSKRNTSSRNPSHPNSVTYDHPSEPFGKGENQMPRSNPSQKKTTFDRGNLYNSAPEKSALNFNNDWYPGFNQQVQQEQLKQQLQIDHRQDQDGLPKQPHRPGPSRSPESSESLTSLSGSAPSSSSNTPNIPSANPQPPNNRRASDELLSLNLSNTRNGRDSNNSQTASTSQIVFQQPPSNPLASSNSASQTGQGGYPTSLSNILNEFSRGGSGVSGSAMLGNHQNNGGFTAPTSLDRPSVLRAGNNGSSGNGGGSNGGGNIFPFIQPTHQNDALLNPNPIPFAFNLSNTEPPDQTWWDQMGGGMLTPGQDPNALDEKANAVAQALNGSNNNNNNNNGGGGGSDNNGNNQRRDRESQSPFDLSSFLTGGSSPGNSTPFDGNQRFTPTSPFGNVEGAGVGSGIQRSNSRNSNSSNPFESFGKFINSSPSPSSNPIRSPSATSNNQSGSNYYQNNNESHHTNRNSSPSNNSFAQSEHAQTFLRLLERKIASMPGSLDSPYTSLGFQPPSMHSSNNNPSSNGLKRKDSTSSTGSDSSSSKAIFLANTAASALEPDGVYSRLAKHPAFLSTNAQELEELVDAIGSNSEQPNGNGKSPNRGDGQERTQQSNNAGDGKSDPRGSEDDNQKDNVAHLFGMLDRKTSYSSYSPSNPSPQPFNGLPSPNGRHAYGLTSPQLQHHNQIQQHLQSQQNRRS